MSIKIQSTISSRDKITLAPEEFEAGQKNDTEFAELLAETAGLALNLSPSPERILEFGAGTGLFSQVFVPKFPKAKIVITEPDSDLLALVPKKLPENTNIEYVQSLAETFHSDQKFDLIMGTEAYHHIPDSEKPRLFQNFFSLLKNEGYLVIGDNFIPAYDPNDPQDRIRALHDFWDPYIAEKQEAGDEDGVRSFIYALKQAESGIMEYKTSMNALEDFASAQNLKLVSKKELSPAIDTRGGYALYVFSK